MPREREQAGAHRACECSCGCLPPSPPHVFPRFADNNCCTRVSAGRADDLRAKIGSFKLKLVTWFALLALLPLAVAFYGYDSLTRRSESARTDAALDAGLRGVVAGYSARLDAATAKARQVARDPSLQRALRRHDRRALAQASA